MLCTYDKADRSCAPTISSWMTLRTIFKEIQSMVSPSTDQIDTKNNIFSLYTPVNKSYSTGFYPKYNKISYSLIQKLRRKKN